MGCCGRDLGTLKMLHASVNASTSVVISASEARAASQMVHTHRYVERSWLQRSKSTSVGAYPELMARTTKRWGKLHSAAKRIKRQDRQPWLGKLNKCPPKAVALHLTQGIGLDHTVANAS